MTSTKRIVGFVASAAFQRLVGFLLMSYLTLHLPAEEFAKFSLFLSLLVLFSGAGGLALQLSPSRLAFDYPNATDRADLIKTLLFSSVSICSLFYFTLAFLNQATHWLGPSIFSSSELLVIGAMILGTLVLEMVLSIFRYEGHIRRYARLVGLNVVITAGFVILFDRYQGPSLRSILAGYLSAMAFTIAQSIFELRERLRGSHFNVMLLKTALTYSAPIAVHNLFNWAIQHSGRWIGTAYVSLDEIAPYLLMLQIVGVVGMLARAIFDSATPQFGLLVQKNDWDHIKSLSWKLSGIAAGLVALAYLCAGGLLYFSKIPWPKYVVISPLFLGLALGINLVDIAYVRGSQLLWATKHSGRQAQLSGITALGVALMSLFLVGKMGTAGLVLSTFFGTLFLAVSFNTSAYAIIRKIGS